MSGEQKVGASVLLALLVWGIGLVSSAVVGNLPQPAPPELMLIPPVLAVFLIGVCVADHWWTRGALLMAVPPAVMTLLIVSYLIVTRDGSDGSAAFAGLFIVRYAMLTIQVAVAAVIVAALGVLVGQRRARGAHV